MALRETESNAYAKFLGDRTKSIMVCYGIFWSGQYPGQYQNIGRVPPGSYWSQDPHILVVGIPVLACARVEFVQAH